MKYIIQRKSFLLLEVLIAFTLVLCFTFPFIKSPLHLFKSEKKELNAIEFERIANYGFTEILTMIYQNEIKWNDIQVKDEKDAKFYSLSDYSSKNNQKIRRKYQLIRKNIKLSSDGRTYIELKINQNLSLNEDDYFYSHFLLVKNKNSSL